MDDCKPHPHVIAANSRHEYDDMTVERITIYKDSDAHRRTDKANDCAHFIPTIPSNQTTTTSVVTWPPMSKATTQPSHKDTDAVDNCKPYHHIDTTDFLDTITTNSYVTRSDARLPPLHDEYIPQHDHHTKIQTQWTTATPPP